MIVEGKFIKKISNDLKEIKRKSIWDEKWNKLTNIPKSILNKELRIYQFHIYRGCSIDQIKIHLLIFYLLSLIKQFLVLFYYNRLYQKYTGKVNVRLSY